jgi:hypothetical protein
MSLQTVLAEIDPGWYAAAAADRIDPRLIARARGSALGERLLARWLVAGPAATLLAPTPQREIGQTAVRWPRDRLGLFVRDLGVLAMAPAIRAEVGRDAVRRLKQALGNSYLLALDRTVWDGRVAAEIQLALGGALHTALAPESEGHAALYALFDRQGRAELRVWAQDNDRALGEWATLLHPREDHVPTVLPAKQVQLLHEHHLARAATPASKNQRKPSA